MHTIVRPGAHIITESPHPRIDGLAVEILFVRSDGRIGQLRSHMPGDWRVFLGRRGGFVQAGEPFESAAIARLELLRLMGEMR